MKQALFLGIATVLDAIGAFLSSIQHRYTAYGCFAAAILMATIAVWTTYRSEYRLRRGTRELGNILVELSQCELAAYDGTDASQYDELHKRIEKIKSTIHEIAEKYLDSSIESRFLAVNVLDIQLDEATKSHFLHRAQGSFWTMYQQIRGWRNCVVSLLQELRR